MGVAGERHPKEPTTSALNPATCTEGSQSSGYTAAILKFTLGANLSSRKCLVRRATLQPLQG